MYRVLLVIFILVFANASYANGTNDRDKIVRAVLDYIESQRTTESKLKR